MHGLLKLNSIYGVSRIDLKHFIYQNLSSINFSGRGYSGAFLKSQSIKTGHKLSKYIATIKKNNSPTEVVCDYLKSLRCNVIRSTVDKIEPCIFKVDRLWNEHGWEFIDMIRLGMSENSNKLFSNFQALHNLHRSVTEPSMVAYYPSLRHMREGREVKTRLGKYLTTFKNEFSLSESDIKAIVEGYNGFLEGQKGWVVSFIEHNDPEGWVNAYSDDRAIRSCMTGESAVRVYAHELSVLRLAVLKNSGGVIIARSIVRDDENKGYLRIYPAPDNAPEGRFLKDYLSAIGYDSSINLNGCLLLGVTHNHSGWVAPYIDSGHNGTQTGTEVVIEGRTYIEIGHGYLDLAQTSGSTEELNSCSDCGEHMTDDESTWIEYHDHSVCEHCANDNYTYAYSRHGQTDVPRDNVIYCETDHEYYDIDYLGQYDIYQCNHDDQFYHADEIIFCDGGAYHVSYCVRLDHEHDGDNYCFNEFAHTLSDGSKCHSDDAEELQEALSERYDPDSFEHNESEVNHE